MFSQASRLHSVLRAQLLHGCREMIANGPFRQPEPCGNLCNAGPEEGGSEHVTLATRERGFLPSLCGLDDDGASDPIDGNTASGGNALGRM